MPLSPDDIATRLTCGVESTRKGEDNHGRGYHRRAGVPTGHYLPTGRVEEMATFLRRLPMRIYIIIKYQYVDR